jgi:hypothetical protein
LIFPGPITSEIDLRRNSSPGGGGRIISSIREDEDDESYLGGDVSINSYACDILLFDYQALRPLK